MAKAARKKPLRQQPAFKKLKEMLKQPLPHDLLWHHQAGECVDKLFPKEGGRQFGEGRMPEITAALGKPQNFANILWLYRDFFTKYDRSEVRWLCDSANTGFRLTWTHIRYLLPIEDPDDLDEFQNRCIDEKWSTDELLRSIKEYQGSKSSGGRKLVPPKTLDAGLAQIIEESETWIKRHRQVWFAPDRPVISMDSKQANPQQLPKQLEEAIKSWQDMERLIKDYLPRLKQLRAWFAKEAARKAKPKAAKRAKTKKKATRKK